MAKSKPRIRMISEVVAQTRGTLGTMLCTINGLESLDGGGDALGGLLQSQRDILFRFKNWIAEQKDFQTNNGLALLDVVFTDAGWEGQGLRWTKEETDEPEFPEQVFVVEFTNKARSKWDIA